MLRKISLVVLAMISGAVATGCVQSADETSGSKASSPLVSTPGPSWGNTVVYDAYVGPVGCSSVETPGGTWSASLTFDGDPSFCSYAWNGSSAADPASLTAVLSSYGVDPGTVYLDQTCTGGFCARPSAAPGVAAPGSGDPGGSVHCVKCSVATIVKTGSGPELHVVMPLSMVTQDPSPLRVDITETYGAMIAQPGNVQAFTVLLPGLPNEPSLASVSAPGGGTSGTGSDW